MIQQESDFEKVVDVKGDNVLLKLADGKTYKLKVAKSNRLNSNRFILVMALFDENDNYFCRISEYPQNAINANEFIVVEKFNQWGITKALNQHPFVEYKGVLDNGNQVGAVKYEYLGKL